MYVCPFPDPDVSRVGSDSCSLCRGGASGDLSECEWTGTSALCGTRLVLLTAVDSKPSEACLFGNQVIPEKTRKVSYVIVSRSQIHTFITRTLTGGPF